MKTFPIYLLEIKKEIRVVFPENREDVSHVDFWEKVVVHILASELKISFRSLELYPYCQRRARVNPDQNVVYYGEKQTRKLLLKIREAVNIPDLEWRFDDHETRTEYDLASFNGLLT